MSIHRVKGAWRLVLMAVLCWIAVACQRSPMIPKLPPDARILAFGDSLTLGNGSSPGHDYLSLLAQLIGYTVINAGVSGEISADGLQRLPALLDEYQPKLLILIHGGNDILRHLDPAQTEANLAAMVDLARQRQIAVLLVAVPEWGVLLHAAPWYQKLADAQQVALEADSLLAILQDPALKSDGVHPNDAGYQRLAQAIADKLKQIRWDISHVNGKSTGWGDRIGRYGRTHGASFGGGGMVNRCL